MFPITEGVEEVEVDGGDDWKRIFFLLSCHVLLMDERYISLSFTENMEKTVSGMNSLQYRQYHTCV